VPTARLDYIVLDLAEIEQARRAGTIVSHLTDHVDVLINNAGVGPGTHGQDRELSRDGYELRLAVNHLAPFALTAALLPFLEAGAKARIINVASAAQAPLDFNDIMLSTHFDPMHAYSQSKLAMVMFTKSLAEYLDGRNISVNALHPGSLLDTKMVRETFGSARGSAESGAENELYLAFAAELDGVTGAYFYERSRRPPHPQAEDEAARRRLWELSEELTGVHYPNGDAGRAGGRDGGGSTENTDGKHAEQEADL
jgi:NAD(P)-dependent dehydrogenase (short-subunit alcohol dehydrogenase family)